MPAASGMAMAGLADLASHVVQGILHLCDLVEDLRDAPREAASLTMELKSLQDVLASICPLARAAGCDDAHDAHDAQDKDDKSSLLLLHQHHHRHPLQSELASLERAVHLCDAEVRTIQALVLAIHRANQKANQTGRGIAKWLRRLLSRLRMLLQKLQLQRRIRALEKRGKAVRLTAATHQASSAPSVPSAPRELALRPAPTPVPVQPTQPSATSSRSYPHVHRYVEVIEPLDAAGYGACSGLCPSMDLLHTSLRMRMPRSPGSVRRAIVETCEDKETLPYQIFRCRSADAASQRTQRLQRPRTPPRPSTPASIPPLTRSTTGASGTSVMTDDRRHDESDSCDTFATAQSVDHARGSASISDQASEPATPPFYPYPRGRSTKHNWGSFNMLLTSYSETEFPLTPEPYQDRDSDDDIITSTWKER